MGDSCAYFNNTYSREFLPKKSQLVCQILRKIQLVPFANDRTGSRTRGAKGVPKVEVFKKPACFMSLSFLLQPLYQSPCFSFPFSICLFLVVPVLSLSPPRSGGTQSFLCVENEYPISCMLHRASSFFLVGNWLQNFHDSFPVYLFNINESVSVCKWCPRASKLLLAFF